MRWTETCCGRRAEGLRVSDGRLGWWCREDGSNLVEIALVLPVYLMLVFALISFSIVLFTYCNASYATRAAARYAALHSSTSLLPCSAATIQGIVTPFLWGAPSAGTSVSTTWNSSNNIGSTVTVAVTMTYSTGMPYTNLSGLVVTATARETIIH